MLLHFKSQNLSMMSNQDFLYVPLHNFKGLRRKLLSLSKATANKRTKYFLVPMIPFDQKAAPQKKEIPVDQLNKYQYGLGNEVQIRNDIEMIQKKTLRKKGRSLRKYKLGVNLPWKGVPCHQVYQTQDWPQQRRKFLSQLHNFHKHMFMVHLIRLVIQN